MNDLLADPPPERPGVAAFRFTAGADDRGRRLDHVLAERVRGFSRSALKRAVLEGRVTVGGGPAKPSRKLETHDVVAGEIAEAAPDDELTPQEMPLAVLYEDASLLVLDKPPGLTVHPGAGQRDGTLANGLAHRFGTLSDAGGPLRPGIVHRLDRDTSGVMVVAKTNNAHFSLAGQFQARETAKEYLALVEGGPAEDRCVVAKPIGRSPSDPAKMAVDLLGGKPAETAFEVLERFDGFAYVRCLPKTGRTHQIRVHLRSLGCPIVCDALYGRRRALLRSDLGLARRASGDDALLLSRQALHAHKLRFTHPMLGRPTAFEAAPPADFRSALEALRARSTSAAPPREGSGR